MALRARVEGEQGRVEEGSFTGIGRSANGRAAAVGGENTTSLPLPGPENGELKFGQIKIEELSLDGLIIKKPVLDNDGKPVLDNEGHAIEEDVVNEEDPRYSVAKTYLDFLNDPRNRLHFAHPPRDVREMIETKDKKDHILIATRVERVEGKLTEVVVGGARLTDNVEPENEHWISLWVVDPNKQHEGIGRRTLREIADWAYENPAYDGRKRDHLHLAINLDIEGAEAVEKVVKKAGFNHVQKKLAKEVNYWNITYADGSNELSPTNPDFVLFGENLQFSEVTRRDGTKYEKAVMENGTVVEIVKKPTRRYGFSYVEYLEDRNPKHKVLRWQKRHPKAIRLPEVSQDRLF